MRRNAMVIGDRSAGAVMAAIHVPLTLMINQERSIEYGMSVTVSDPVMPDGARLENVGVIPNVAAVPTALDLANHRDPALSFALEMAGVKMDAVAAGKIFH
jgi:C-terminal processing protease CtpA/Prc